MALKMWDILKAGVPAPISHLLKPVYVDQDGRARGRIRDRRVLLSVSAVLSLLLYGWFVGGYYPNLNLFDRVAESVVTSKYTFYSGGKGGFYIKVGEYLQNGEVPFFNQPTAGSVENIRKVRSHRRSFGIAQDDVLAQAFLEKEQLQRISPLFSEAMYVLYRTEDYHQHIQPSQRIQILQDDLDSGADPPPPILGRDLSGQTRRFLEQAPINLGSPTGGTFMLGSATLDLCGITPRKIYHYGFQDAFELLKKGDIQVVFATARYPLTAIQKLIQESDERDSIGLMSIDPALIPDLNRRFGSRLRPVVLPRSREGAGDDGLQEHVSTFATQAILIASPDVPDPVIRLVAEELGSMQNDGSRAYGKGQLDDLLVEEVLSRHWGELRSLLMSALLFVGFVGFAMAAILALLLWVVSTAKHAQHFRSLSRLYNAYLPANADLKKLENRPFRGRWLLPDPGIDRGEIVTQEEMLVRLTSGLSELLQLSSWIRGDFETGGITRSHLRHLMDELYSLKEFFQNNLARRLAFLLDSGDPVPAEALRSYFTCGYLRRLDFEQLRNMTADAPPPKQTGSRKRTPRKKTT